MALTAGSMPFILNTGAAGASIGMHAASNSRGLGTNGS